MRKATLTRSPSTDEGTFGRLVADSGFFCFTGELPWRANATGTSCIPPGKYTCSWRYSPKHGDCYHVDGVPGRTDIEIHAANFVGDAARGLRCQLLGCIAPGTGIGQLDGQRAIVSSKIALLALETEFKREPFELTII